MSRFRAPCAVDNKGMTQQGDDNWWDKLYDDSAPDTAPAESGDTLDDHFTTAARATTGPPARDPAPPPPASPPGVPGPGPAPWETPPEGPRTFSVPPPPPPVAPPVAPPVEAPTVQVTVPPERDPGEPEPRLADEVEPETGPGPDLTVEVSVPRPRTGYVGSRPPTYEAEPTALPVARPGELGELVSDTVLDGARYGTCTLRAASVRGDSARYRGEPRRDALLTARFGHDETALVLVAVAAGSRAAEDAHLAASDACQWIAEAVCRSHARLSEDIRSGRRGDLKSGLHRLTDRTYGKLRARAAERGLASDEYTATLRCLLVPADPECRTRVFFGIGAGGLFRLRDGSWQDIEPLLPEPAAVTGAPVLGFGSPPPPGRPPPRPRRATGSPWTSGSRPLPGRWSRSPCRHPPSRSASVPPSPDPATPCSSPRPVSPSRCAVNPPSPASSPPAGPTPRRPVWPRSSPTPSCG